MKRSIILCFLVFSLATGCRVPVNPGPPSGPVILAEMQVWHGLSSHQYMPYDSRDPVVVARQIDKAQSMGISGFVINWYGPAAGVANDQEREFQNLATAELFTQAAQKNFYITLLYDEGTISSAEANPADYQARALSDLQYAVNYFSSPAYLKIRCAPALFVFPYDNVDKEIDWGEIRQALGVPVTLFDKDPDPTDPTPHDSYFDGFYAWVTATNGAWDPDGLEWGETYLNWFYPTMKSPGYAGKVTVGGVWAGFDDSLAAWGDNRFISRRGTETYDGTMALATQHQAPFIMIETWNDFEEGSDIEFGTAMAVNLDDNDAALLVRSSPLRVDWNPAHTVPVLQVYKEGVLLYNQPGINGAYFSLQSGCTYELKLWAQDLPSPLSRWVVIRHQDPIPGVTPVDADP